MLHVLACDKISTPKNPLPLPDELVGEILAFLPERDILTLRRVSHGMRGYAEDPSVWNRRILENGWLAPALTAPWRDADMVAHYRVQSQFYERPPGALMRRGEIDCRDVDTVDRAVAAFPSTLPELHLSTFPTLQVWQKIALHWPHLRRIEIRRVPSAPTPFSVDGLQNLGELEDFIFEHGEALSDERLDALVAAVPNLRSLTLRNLAQVGDALAVIAGLRKLTRLELPSAALQKLPASLAALRNVTTLNLSHGRQSQATPELLASIVECFPNLEHLNLSGRIVAREQDLEVLKALPLRTLNVSQTGIRTLPKPLCKSGLRTLDVSLNHSFRLPTFAQALNTLEEIKLGSTGLDAFPEVLASIPSLIRLTVSSNPGIRFDTPLAPLVNLRELIAVHCGLESLPESFAALPKLRKLRLSRNSIVALPATMGHLTQLTHLDLSDNGGWQQMPASIGQLRHLAWLALPQVNGETLPRLASHFPKLRYVSFDGRPTFMDLPLDDTGPHPLTRAQFQRALEGCTQLRWVAYDDMSRNVPLGENVRPCFQGNRNFIMSYNRWY